MKHVIIYPVHKDNPCIELYNVVSSNIKDNIYTVEVSNESNDTEFHYFVLDNILQFTETLE